jgi:uncharacterized repeat protein (TIGR01451 family)
MRNPRRITGAALAALLLATGPLARAADNTATGDIAGVDADLTDSNTFTINSATLALVKTAFLTDGTQLTSGATVAAGTLVQFLVYLDNPTGVAVADVNVEDVLDPAFVYQAGTLRIDNSVGTGSTEAAVYAAVNATTALDDAVDGTDAAGISGPTVSAGSGAGNTQVDAAAGSIWALLFTTRVQ